MRDAILFSNANISRGKGLGKILMLKTEEYCISRGFKTAYLTTHDQQVGVQIVICLDFVCLCELVCFLSDCLSWLLHLYQCRFSTQDVATSSVKLFVLLEAAVP